MPSKTYNNLAQSKKRNLENAALEEFSKYTYDQISINRIIQSINMPRGTFYLYFTDKEDLYLYIICKYHNILLNLIEDVIVKNVPDIINAYKELFDVVCKYCDNELYGAMVKKFFMGLNRNIEDKVMKALKLKVHDRLIDKIIEQFSDSLAYNDVDDIKDILCILNNTIMHACTGYYLFGLDKTDIKKRYYNQLDIICRGIAKKNNSL